MQYDLADLIIEPKKRNSILRVFLADENLSSKSNLGQLFMLVDIESKESGLNEKMSEFYEMIRNEYYSSPIPSVESSLEMTCQSINLNLKDVFKKPDIWFKKLNILVGVIKEDELVFSHLGKFSGYLVRKNKITQVLNTADVETSDEINFSQITSGKISENDSLIFANYTLFDFFSLEKIKNIITKLNPEQSAEQLKNLVLENSRETNLIALMLKFKKNILEESNKQEVTTEKYLEELYGSKESLDRLENLKKKTNTTLADCIWPNIKKVKNSVLNLKKSDKSKKEIKISENIKRESIFKKIGESIKNFVLKYLAYRTTIIVLIILFVASLFYVSYVSGQKQKNTANSAIVNLIENKKEEALAALIYQDKEKANELLVEAQSELEKINLYNKKWQAEFDKQSNELRKSLNKINNIFEIDVEKITQIENANISKVIKNSETNETYLIADGKIYNLKDSNLNLLPGLEPIKVKNVSFLEDNKGVIILDENNKFYIYKNSNLDELNITVLEDAIISDIKTYGERIYYLDNLHAIYRVANALTANPEINIWYSEDKDLVNNAKNIFIDGDIWVGGKNNVYNFYRGEKQAFSISNLNTELGQDLILYTDDNLNNLFVIDKLNSRLIVTDKNGIAKEQFLNDQLKNAENFVVVENVAIFNSAGEVWKIELKSE